MSIYKTSFHTRAILMVCLIAPFAQGCATDLTDQSAIPPETTTPGTGPFGQQEQTFDNLLIHPFQETTAYTTQPIRGQGPANGSLLVTTNGEQRSYNIPSSGTFCVNVNLISNSNNELLFQALNIDGLPVLETPLERHVVQSGRAPADNAPVASNPTTFNAGPTVHNMFSNMIFDGPGVNATSGWEALFDDPSSTTYVKNHTWGENYFNFDIDVESPIFNVVINSDNQTPLQEIDVYYSNVENGLDLFSNFTILGSKQTINEGWYKWGEVPFGNTLSENNMLSPNGFSGTEAKRIAFHFTNDSNGFWSEVTGWGEHGVNFISVNAIDIEATELSNNSNGFGGNTCQGGGQ